MKPKKKYVLQEDIPKVEKTEEKEEVKELEGEVFGVDSFLNVRKEPKIEKGNVIGMLQKGTKIIVLDKKSITNKDGEEWYKIKVLNPALNGYAMKKYIKVH